MPPELGDPDADAAQFGEDPWITPPIRMDYGKNVKLGKNVYFNFGCTFVDGCVISIGSRTLVGPNVSFYTGSHPLDPELRNGTNGPEYGKEIHVGDDCWIGGNVILLPGVTLGYGVVVGAGSVVTKVRRSLAIPMFHPDLFSTESAGCACSTRCSRKPCKSYQENTSTATINARCRRPEGRRTPHGRPG